jgi:hypothetical protein
VLRQAGFRNVEVHEHFDTFRGTNKESTARRFKVEGVNVLAYK